VKIAHGNCRPTLHLNVLLEQILDAVANIPTREMLPADTYRPRQIENNAARNFEASSPVLLG